MHTFIITLAIFFSEVVFHNAEPRFSVIYHPVHVERLYLRVLDREPHVEPNLDLKAEVKHKICVDIIGNDFFNISEYYTLIFPKFLNPTNPIKVAVEGKTVQEFAFMCSAVNRLTKKTTEYYVSDSYNVNEASNWLKNRIAGHFIFRYIQKDNIWVIHSFAEEVASVIGSSEKKKTDFVIFPPPQHDIENLYADAMTGIRSRNEANDPVCKLSSFDKVRLCSSVLKSWFFEDQVKFIPTSDHVASKCVSRTISLLKFNARDMLETKIRRMKESGKFFNNTELLLICEAILKPPVSIPQSFYVSRGYAPNQVFVSYYSPESGEGQYKLLNLSFNVSVVVE